MALTRRRFVKTLGAASVTSLGGSASPAQTRSYTLPPADPNAIRLDSNENPNAPGPSVAKAVMEALAQGHRYPRNAAQLAELLAKAHGVSSDNVFVGAGSGELLKASVPAFVDAKRPLVTGLPTFDTCARVARSLGLAVREVPVDSSMRLDLKAMEDAAGGAGLLYFCNPNNPTSTMWPTRDVEAMIDRLGQRSPETVILVDEAYAHFVESPEYKSLASRAAKDRRLLVLRTFSKVYGLAGLRIGYAVGHPDTIAALRLHTTSDFLAVTSIAAAIAALGDEALVRDQVQRNREARAATIKVFQDLGLTVFPSEANFILVDVKRRQDEFIGACRERSVSLGRPFSGLSTQVRISIGTTDEMRRAAEVFKAVLAKA
jgi:histidinol-phosphate aminotransferase